MDADTFEEAFVLSKRKAVVFVFFTALVIIILIYIVGFEFELKKEKIGMSSRVIEGVTPLLSGPITIAKRCYSCQQQSQKDSQTTSFSQRDPRKLISGLLGSVYGRQDYTAYFSQ